MFFIDWITSLLSLLGLWKKPHKLILLGLDNAGKTTLVSRLKDGTFSLHGPTYHPYCQDLSIGGMQFEAYDLGGRPYARRMWKDYIPAVDGIVFLVDSGDKAVLADSKKELDILLSDEKAAHVPILILANKIDLPVAVGKEELLRTLDLFHLLTRQMGPSKSNGGSNTDPDPPTPTGRRPIELFMCSMLTDHGYQEGLHWLTQHIRNADKQKPTPSL